MIAQAPQPVAVPRTRPAIGEAAARRALRTQVARLERELTELGGSAWPRADWSPAGVAGGPPKLLALGELEALRDALAHALARSRRELGERLVAEEHNRRLMEEMLADPASHPWVRVSHADIGEPGCRDWHVRPRFGLLGMLAGWWRVVVSSGCPLQPGVWPVLDRPWSRWPPRSQSRAAAVTTRRRRTCAALPTARGPRPPRHPPRARARSRHPRGTTGREAGPRPPPPKAAHRR